jgi:hypothetical protein
MDPQQEELERRAVGFEARRGERSSGVGAMMAAFAAETLRDRQFELPKDAE